jgi:hypothetical protein
MTKLHKEADPLSPAEAEFYHWARDPARWVGKSWAEIAAEIRARGWYPERLDWEVRSDEVLRRNPYGKTVFYEKIKSGEFPAPLPTTPDRRRRFWTELVLFAYSLSRAAAAYAEEQKTKKAA